MPTLRWRIAWLGYLVFFLMPSFFYDVSWWSTLLGLAIFLPVYFWVFRLQGWLVLGPIVICCILGIVYSTFNYGASTFFIYAAAFAPGIGPPRRAWGTVLGILAVVILTSVLVQPYPYFWLPAGFLTLMVGAATINERQVARTNERLRLSQEEVTRLASIAERERIARDLHDVLGHTLSAITVKSQLAARLADRDPGRAAEEIRDVEQISRQALQEVRSAVAGYRAESLAGEIDNARRVLEAAGVELRHNLDESEIPPLGPIQEGVLALALREAVTNILRHAEAKQCVIRFAVDGEQVRLEIEDDGSGSNQPEGMGLAGMRERVASLGGRLERRSQDGTQLIISLPHTVLAT